MADLQITMIDVVPIPATDLQTEVVEGEVLLYDPKQTRAVYLNPTAALVFSLCDGKRSVREIIRVLSECYPDGAASLSNDVLTTINELRENGVLAIG
jgi:Coenzyme PQQ synthesis protein D (PqqD)